MSGQLFTARLIRWFRFKRYCSFGASLALPASGAGVAVSGAGVAVSAVAASFSVSLVLLVSVTASAGFTSDPAACSEGLTVAHPVAKTVKDSNKIPITNRFLFFICTPYLRYFSTTTTVLQTKQLPTLRSNRHLPGSCLPYV